MLEIDEPTTAPTMDELWRAHAAELVGFATVLVGPADAHDIVVEAFLRSYGAVTTGRVTRPRAYLFRAVVLKERGFPYLPSKSKRRTVTVTP